MANESKQEKAQRFINEGRVFRLSEHVYAVKGDTGGTAPYLVCVPNEADVTAARDALGAAPWVGICACEARGACSHMLAALAVERHIAGGSTWVNPAPSA